MDFSLAGKNRDLNQAREKLEQMIANRRALTDEVSSLQNALTEKEKEIEK